MFEQYTFIDERGQDVTGCVFLDIGDKIINVNGEWECVGMYSNKETTIIRPTFFEKIFKIETEPQRIYKRTYLMKRYKKA